MGNNNSARENEKAFTDLIQPVKDIYDKLNNEIKEGLLNLLARRVEPKDWHDVEKTYDYSARDLDEKRKESFKITFFPNGTCSTLEIKLEGKEEYKDEFGFGVFFLTKHGINVQIVTIGNTKGWSYKHEITNELNIREFYFGRRKVKEELISYSELVKDKTAGPYILKLSY